MKNIVGKVVVLGRQGVGKTSTIMRYIENTFTHHVAPTIGASFFSCKTNIEGNFVTLQIWDTAGQERFKAMTPMFYRNANAALLIFDITSRKSFENIQDWVKELKGNVLEPMVLVVVGNKVDLSDVREVTRDEALQYAASINASYLECSAKTDHGIGVIFEKISIGLLKLSGQKISTLKVYDEDLMATSSELEATDTANEETVNLSKHNIAIGKKASGCC